MPQKMSSNKSKKNSSNFSELLSHQSLSLLLFLLFVDYLPICSLMVSPRLHATALSYLTLTLKCLTRSPWCADFIIFAESSIQHPSTVNPIMNPNLLRSNLSQNFSTSRVSPIATTLRFDEKSLHNG